MADTTEPRDPKPMHLQPSAAAVSGASAVVRTPVHLKPSAAAGASATVSMVPLIQVASAAVYPSAGASQVAITPQPNSPLPNVDVGLAENAWDLATLGTGFGVGYAVGRLPGGVAGGVGCYLWGRVRWRQVQRKKP